MWQTGNVSCEATLELRRLEEERGWNLEHSIGNEHKAVNSDRLSPDSVTSKVTLQNLNFIIYNMGIVSL